MHLAKYFLLLSSFLTFSLLHAQEGDEWNQQNSAGGKEGKWRAFHENGKLRYTGQFNDDKPFDVFRYFFETGDLQSVLEFENPGTANAKLFYQTGDLMAKGKYINQKKEGEWVSFGAKNIKIESGFYSNGKKAGIWNTFFENGNIASEVKFEDNIEQGTFKSFYDNGKVKQESKYIDGELSGLSIFYKPDGKKFLKGIYKNGMRDKNWVYYDDNMKVEKVLEYQEGILMNPEILEEIDYSIEPYRDNVKDVLEFDDLRGRIKYE